MKSLMKLWSRYAAQPVIPHLPRNPEGRVVVPVIPRAPHRHSRVGGNPQSGVTTRQHQPYSPSPLMGGESKARVKQNKPHPCPSTQVHQHRHSRVGGNPQGGVTTRQHQPPRPVIADLIRNPEGWQGNNKSKPTTFPSPLMGEESKVRVKRCNTTIVPSLRT